MGSNSKCLASLRDRSPFLAAAAATLVLLQCGSVLGATAPAAGVGTITAIQNQVETRRAKEGGYAPSTLNQALYEKDRVRTGPGSRAAILYSDRTLHRINERSEIEILPPSEGQPGVLKVISGTHYFSSRSPKDYGRIETPTVTAAIKGTEFVVDVGEDNVTKITMLEGVVEASNTFGAVSVGQGEQAYVEPGKAPVKRILVHPRDAVSWALYYPPVFGGADEQRIKDHGPQGANLVKAGQLLSTGQVEAARPLIDSALAAKPDDPIALSLASVIATATDNKAEAMRLGERATAADPRSASAALALSYAAQANFDIPRARALADVAAALDPSSPVAQARAAELRLAEGDIAGATAAANEAVKRNPGDARALSVLGFTEMAQMRTKEGKRLFEQAVQADSSLALAQLGLGIANIRVGEVVKGRENLQTATALDPDDSLLRSYLGKALYEEKLDKDAGKELAEAKRLDPNDPTPYLYDAIRKQDGNRPAEALEDLQASIARNDNRAVYRSRLLLDEDLAVRGVDLARIYNDLGFEQLGLVTARRSADIDQANFSSHLFLAGNYRQLPGFAPAYFSEILQARIYQPVSVNAVRPDVVNESVSFNEYTELFDRPRIRGFGEFAYQQTNTDLNELGGANTTTDDLVAIDNSDGWRGSVTGTINRDRLAAAISYEKYDDDGFRFNNDRTVANYRAFVEWAPTYRDTFQLNALLGRQDFGDLPLRLYPAILTSERLDSRLWNIGLGYHRIMNPSQDLVVSLIYNKTRQDNSPFVCDPLVTPCDATPTGVTKTGILEGPQLEGQYVWRMPRVTWIFGAGGFDGTLNLSTTGAPDLEDSDQFVNGYAYASLHPWKTLDVTVGLSGEHVEAPTGLILPRDSQIGAAELGFSETKTSPKLGVTYRPIVGTTLRGALYYRLSPAIGRVQTLEPTQVAGFNQFFFEPGGTRSKSWGLGVDQEFASRYFMGAQYLRRHQDIPQGYCDNPNPASGCTGLVANEVDNRTSENVDVTAYLNTVITHTATFGVDYSYATRDYDYTKVNNDSLFQDYSKTWILAPNLRFFWPSGLFFGAKGSWYNQQIDEFDDLSSPDRSVSQIHFWLFDVSAGYRLPKRFGSIVLDARNLSDQEFEFYDRSVEQPFIPARSVTLTLRINN